MAMARRHKRRVKVQPAGGSRSRRRGIRRWRRHISGPVPGCSPKQKHNRRSVPEDLQVVIREEPIFRLL